MRKNQLHIDQYGKVQPQEIETERVLLGMCLMEKEAIAIAIDLINEFDFYNVINEHIFRAIKEMFLRAEPINTITVANNLKKKQLLELIGGPLYLVQLTAPVTVVREEDVTKFSLIIKEASIARNLIQITGKAQSKAFEQSEDIFKITEELTNEAVKLTSLGVLNAPEQIGKIAIDSALNAIKIRAGEIKEGFIPTHISDYNEHTGGFAPPDLVIIAARPGMGKTALALSVILMLARRGVECGMFSLEMSKQQLTDRFISMISGLPLHTVRKVKLLSDSDFLRYEAAVTELRELPIFIDDTPAITVGEAKTKTHLLKVRHGVKIVFVDYIQLMSGQSGKGNREGEVSEISRGLKEMAKINDIPVIALSQLSRKVEERPSKKPQLADLRESGAIEQDADVVLLLFRPYYYHIDQYDTFSEEDTKEITEMIIAKNRHGSTAIVYLRFKAYKVFYQGFYD